MTSGSPLGGYAFGDSDIARERLGIVADAFAAPTRAFLDEFPPGELRYVVDMGCGPGYTTELLRDAFPYAWLTGLDASEAMLEEARTRVPGAYFAVADVTAPLLLPVQLVYSRLLLGHLPDPAAALIEWAGPLRGAGYVLCKEPVRYRSDDEWFARYEDAVSTVVATRGANLWAGEFLAHADVPGCRRVVDRVVEHPVPAARAAGMFWRNAVTWSHEVAGGAELIEHFRTREQAEGDEVVMWEIRQTAWVKTPG